MLLHSMILLRGEGALQKLRPNQADRILKSYCENLNQKYFEKKIDPVIGREEETEQLKQILARRNKNNVLILELSSRESRFAV